MIRRSPAPRIMVSLVAIAGFAAYVALAGPLDPPAGPVTSTYKTLSDVEPRIAINTANTPGDADSLFKITQPGSYYLTGNITGVIGKHGIEIAASGVSLDLNGFDLVGVPAMGAFDGVSVTANGLTSIAVVNGSVRNWGADGVDLRTFLTFESRVEGVVARGNAGNGIKVGGGCTITSSSASNNTVGGIDTYDNCSVSRCSAYQNIGNGISLRSACTASECTARVNGHDGIECLNNCVILCNVCSNNGLNADDGAGIHVTGSSNRIESNNCTGADRGIDVASLGNIIIRNTCSGNSINWLIAADNVCGPILDRTAPASAAISGNFAPDSTGSSHPNANFSY